jgi:hypothetical protein
LRRSRPNRWRPFLRSGVFACFFCNIFRKHRSESLPHVAFILRVQEASVILGPRRRGAPEVVYGGSQEFPRSCGRGEGAKKLSSVPGGHILGGVGEPAQLFRPMPISTSQS